MVSPLLSLGLAVVLIYCTLLVQPQSFLVLVPPSPPPSPPAPSMPPPPSRSLQQDKRQPLQNKSDPVTVSSPPPPKKKTIGQHPKLHTKHEHRTPPPSKEKLNLGKKIGLLFMGIAAILQVFVVAFLVVKSRQMFKNKNSH